MIFPWRIVAKGILLRLLPPLFRATSIIFDVELPARRHYRQATSDYSGVPPTPIRSLPSFIDLHSGTPPEMPSGDNSPLASDSTTLKPGDYLKRRGSSSDSSIAGDHRGGGVNGTDVVVPPVGAGRGKRRTRIERAKYDAEGPWLSLSLHGVRLTSRLSVDESWGICGYRILVYMGCTLRF